MKLDARSLIGPLVAALVLILTVQQTRSALLRAGHWGPSRRTSGVHADDPYARLDQAIAAAGAALPGGPIRDPFAFGSAPVAATPHVARPKMVKPPRIPDPVLTAIIWDSDPRALIRFNGRDYTVRSGGQFAEYRVTNISRDRVVLDKAGLPLVLNRPLKGE